jgi:Arc/MetJ-type ribon-helix-helix transcriptional regulator
MTLHLTEDLERFVRDAVRAGLYAGEEDVIRDALIRLRQSLPPAPNTPARDRKATRRAKPEGKPVTPAELNRRLLASGLVMQLPDPTEDIDDSEDFPVEIHGEPLSETIIRERR